MISADSAVTLPMTANAGPASGRAPVAAACRAASRLAPDSHRQLSIHTCSREAIKRYPSELAGIAGTPTFIVFRFRLAA